jgi:alkylation response protein AidB-like acyl-CoA dehydrogenase
MKESAYEPFRREFIARIWRDLDPFEGEIEQTERLPHDRLIPILKDMGAFGLMVPERFGGAGLTVTQYLPILAELSKIQGGIRVLVHVHNTVAHALADLGSEAQQAAILPGCARGTMSISFGLTEPDHGTGADLGTTAVRDGDDYIINGHKWLITNSDIASHFMVFAKTDPTAGERGISTILVERGTPGFAIQSLPECMGCKGAEHGALTFENVRAPVANILGEEGMGIAQMEHALEISRLFIAATSLGTAERSFELAVQHAKKRVTFGRPLARRQAIQRYIAEMATDIYALRTMISDAGEKWDRGLRIPAEASMCKLFGLEAVGRVTDRALLVFGGIGYTRQHPIERLYRDARLNYLEEGPPTIQYMVAAKEFVEGYSWDR